MSLPDRPPLEYPPRITVIIPMYQGVSLVTEALESIKAQTLSIAHIIVVDDGSTDGGADFVEEKYPEVQVLRKEHTGIIETLSLGLDHVKTELLALLDHDDRWRPQKTELQVAAMMADPGLDMVFGQTERFISNVEGERVVDIIPGICKGGGLFRTDSFRQVGGFGGTHDFIDWYARAQEAGLRQLVLADVVFERRMHANSVGMTGKDRQTKSYLTTLKAMLDRRRGSTGAS